MVTKPNESNGGTCCFVHTLLHGPGGHLPETDAPSPHPESDGVTEAWRVRMLHATLSEVGWAVRWALLSSCEFAEGPCAVGRVLRARCAVTLLTAGPPQHRGSFPLLGGVFCATHPGLLRLSKNAENSACVTGST